eukprot:CAMPEP_0170602234 /NCGR_PEP_ID=MMETSP0224-20130122/18283_1 /TAXON_ID=285029 /ORGANISM="Togula jolla, Strain CCCM 725" /LENGTH=82 /DNA_ID=CAMNT_0010927061 /DNA_START=926 /DNA_END=1177 /DNA_ORIENTATION=-
MPGGTLAPAGSNYSVRRRPRFGTRILLESARQALAEEHLQEDSAKKFRLQGISLSKLRRAADGSGHPFAATVLNHHQGCECR